MPRWFVIEEVVFRGVEHTHVHRPGDRHGLLSALFFSAMWGIWHLPLATAAGLGELPLPFLVAAVVVPHCVVGVPLSFAWRPTGLWVPGAAHAFGDAVRDALSIGI